MTSTKFTCGTKTRLAKVRSGGALNGIDYLEVDHPAQTLLRVYLLKKPDGVLTTENFKIEGGVRNRVVTVVDATDATDNVYEVSLDTFGDFSTYCLRITAGASTADPPANFDSRLCEVEFSFKVECPSDFDCKTDDSCPEQPPEEIAIDYLAKDYPSFKRLIMDRLALTMPEWRERNPADMQMALVELLAYVADHLSYYQDAVATEAYLATARKRTSIKRHARLLDYAVHEGCSSRAFICVEVETEGLEILENTVFLDSTLGTSTVVSSDEYSRYPAPVLAFESLHNLYPTAGNNRIELHAWSELDCCLPTGATQATLRPEKGKSLDLRPGDLLAFYEQPVRVKTSDGTDSSPAGGDASGALLRDGFLQNRHVVRLTDVRQLRDAFEEVDVVEVTWHAEDALPFPLQITMTYDGEHYDNITLACGNVLIARHGQTLPAEFLVPPQPTPGEKYWPTIQSRDLSFAVEFDAASASQRSAAEATRFDPRDAVAQVELSNQHTGEIWFVQPDLLNSGESDPDVVVEVENDRSVHLRFGDGINGKPPGASEEILAKPTVGCGTKGNIGSDVLCRVVTDESGITAVWNPLPASGGLNPETLEEVRQFAPEAFKTQERAVTEADYVDVALRHAGIQSAVAQFRWTGSWATLYLAVDRIGGLPVLDDETFRDSLLSHLNAYRMAGVDIELRDPIYVPLLIEMYVCVKSNYFCGDVEARLLQAFSTAEFSNGERGFFHPDNFTFGQNVYLSQVVSRAMSVTGVDHVEVLAFRRLWQADNLDLEAGRISIGLNEIARLSNDPSQPQDGRISFSMEGGL